MLCSRFPELEKSLQTRTFSTQSFSRDFKLFAWVAARLLHTYLLLRMIEQTAATSGNALS
jgi:hypothetical protein